MELIRWIRQEMQKIKTCWILSSIKAWLVGENLLKSSRKQKERPEKKKYYKEPDLKKRKGNRRV